MSKITFKTLSLTNFMSYGNNITTINLQTNDPTMIVGINYDAAVDGQLDSNGAGKSTILEALVFCLYDKTISNKDIGSLINNINKKNLEVTLIFSKGDYDYKIIRSRKTKTKGDIIILRKPINEERDFELSDGENKHDDITPDSINASDKLIAEKIIAIPFEIFARMVVFSSSFGAFLDLPERHTSKTSQTSIMEELFGYTEITQKAESLKKEIKAGKAEMDHLIELNSEILKHKERNKSQILSTENRISEWDKSNGIDIDNKQQRLDEISKVDLTAQENLLQSLGDLQKKKSSYDHQISIIKNNIKNIQDNIEKNKSKEEKIIEITENIKAIEKKVNFKTERDKLEKLEKLTNQSIDYDTDISKINKEIENYMSEIDKIKSELAHLEDDKCPYCLQNFEEATDKIKSKNERLKELETLVNDSSEIGDSTKSNLDNINAKISNIKDELTILDITLLNNLERKYDSFKTELNTLQEENTFSYDDNLKEQVKNLEHQQTEIERLDNEICDIESNITITSLSGIEKIRSEIGHLRDSIKSLSQAVNPYVEVLEELKSVSFDNDKNERINELEKILKHQDFLLKLLTKKDSFIRKRLLDNNLPFLNKRLLMYLSLTGLPHKVQFKSDMSPSITQFGTEIGFKSLSSGQKARVNLALAFAFRDVLQARHSSINLCILDECLDVGLGNVGVQMATKMIKSIAERENLSMFVISHRDEITSMFKNQLVIEYKNGFSNLKDAA